MKYYKKTFLLLVPLIAFVSFLCPSNVFADTITSTVSFKTSISGFKTGSDLRYTCGNNTANVVSKVYHGEDESSLSEITSGCNFSLDSLGYSTGDNFVIVEVINFASYNGSAPEFEDITVNPGAIVSDSVNYDEDDFMFGNYTTGSQTVTVYNLNELDSNDVPTGNRYVSEAYFLGSDGISKSASKDLGVIHFPSYCVKINYHVKGTIANTYGSFNSFLDGDESTIVSTGENGDSDTFCEIGGLPITREQFDDFSDGNGLDASYGGVSRSDDYTITVENNEGPYEVSAGSYETTFEISARLDSNISPTGVLYRVLPFVLLIGFVVFGFIFIRRNKVKE